MGKFLTTDDFINRAKKIHGDKYDYSKVEYERSNKKVCIICPEHGEFMQRPNDHLSGCGCKKCAMEVIKSKEMKTNKEFIEQSKEIHGDKYDYSRVDYKGSFIKVCIICPEHGEFWQTPANHLSGKGCKKCAQSSLWDKRGRKTTEDFIKEAKKIHGDKYDYSKVEYINNRTKVTIICPEHGEFVQTPIKHIMGEGCPKCAVKKIWDTRGRITTKEWIEKAKKVHGDKYDYSKVEYKRNDIKVSIICPEHGEFMQTPAKHLHGQECPQCNSALNKEECSLWRELQKRYPEITLTHQYYNSKLFGKKSIDIFFEGKNIAVEYQGGQHFKPIKMFGGNKSFLETCKRDKEKYDECVKNNIKLLYYTKETWNVPEKYIDKVYVNFEELCNEIDKLIENKTGIYRDIL